MNELAKLELRDMLNYSDEIAITCVPYDGSEPFDLKLSGEYEGIKADIEGFENTNEVYF